MPTPPSPANDLQDTSGAEKRRSQRLLVRVAVIVIGTDREGKSFGEVTHTMVINAHGALVELKAELLDGQRVLLRNKQSGERQSCRVVWFRKAEQGVNHAGLEFTAAAPHFWQVDFPPDDWDMPMMRAAVLKEFGHPLGAEEIPRPQAQGDEVLIRVEACGVCHSDLHMAKGDWPDVSAKMSWPVTLGHEAVGRVVELGAKVTGIALNQRVGVGWLYSTCGACEHCREGAENVCLQRKVTGIAAPGGYAEFMRVKASHAIPVPENLSALEAAPLFCAGLTVFHALHNAGLKKGQRVAVFGVGGLGHLALQIARLAGAETIAVDVSEAKLVFATKFGAAQAILATDPNSEKLLKEGGGPHLAVVTAPDKSAYDLAIRTLRRRGTLAVVGLPKEDLTFFADDLVVGEFKIIASAVGTRAEMRELLALASAGKIRCEVETCTLEQINEVFEKMKRGQLLGRAVIQFPPK
ncbi:MAG: alcohol dehydrogenase catalytic domain-containing protein [Acidobacteria bacterium]|nr:alcohol dehydrogenase catalytic domain-containing protein [Acidobacteriota bacterium]MCL5286855.1 alcohol dehydrogenase catalytic domain-containing protein [Acidobacteriota bacterium]